MVEQLYTFAKNENKGGVSLFMEVPLSGCDNGAGGWEGFRLGTSMEGRDKER